MGTIWRNEHLVRRWCSWDGCDGDHYERNRRIGIVFYRFQDIKNKKYYLTCETGGGMDMDWCLHSINHVLAKGEKPVTKEEVETEINRMCKEILKNPEYYKETFED